MAAMPTVPTHAQPADDADGSPTVTRDEPNARTNKRHSAALVASVKKHGLPMGTSSAESSSDSAAEVAEAQFQAQHVQHVQPCIQRGPRGPHTPHSDEPPQHPQHQRHQQDPLPSSPSSFAPLAPPPGLALAQPTAPIQPRAAQVSDDVREMVRRGQEGFLEAVLANRHAGPHLHPNDMIVQGLRAHLARQDRELRGGRDVRGRQRRQGHHRNDAASRRGHIETSG